MRHRIGIIAGDGIGPAVIGAARSVLEAAVHDACTLEFVPVDAGADTFRRTGSALAEADFDRIKGIGVDAFDATLKGPVGLPEVRAADGTEAGTLGGVLRTGLDAYANVRPVRRIPGVPGKLAGNPEIDLVIVRENTEGLYASRGRGVGNNYTHVDQLLVTRFGTERIVRRAFEIAAARSGAPVDGVSRVTCVDKANVLPSLAFFRRVFDEIAVEYAATHPHIVADHRYVDACAADLVERPGHFDVLVTENLLGDILSDLAGALAGGIGLAPSGNLGDFAAYFEPVHGSAPDLAGSDVGPAAANPVAAMLSAALMLDYLGEQACAERLRAAVLGGAADCAQAGVALDCSGVERAVLVRLRAEDSTLI